MYTLTPQRVSGNEILHTKLTRLDRFFTLNATITLSSLINLYMPSFLQNKYIRFGIFGVGGLVVIFIAWISINLLTQSTGLDSMTLSAPSVTNSSGRAFDMEKSSNGMMADSYQVAETESSYYYPPVPTGEGYTSGLESYETSTYSIFARTKEFDALCATLSALKNDPAIHFKTLTSSLNNCYATLFVAEAKVGEVLNTFTGFQGVEVTRNTESVTRHKQQLESQTLVLEQQLASVSRTLVATELQFDEIAAFARSSNDASTLSKTIREKLSLVEQLTQQKISLTSQLSQLYQQAADLQERLDVVQFDVSITRAIPMVTDKYERQWDQAWEALQDEFTDTLIGITAFFGVFLLWVVRIGLYLLVLIVLGRGLWKFGKVVWSKW